MSASSHSDMRHHVAAYFKVFAALIALTIVTVGASYFQLVIPLAIAVALLIATLKGSLVAGFFMHLVSEQRLILAALVLTVALLVALIAIPLLCVKDQVGRRVTVTAPPQIQMEH